VPFPRPLHQLESNLPLGQARLGAIAAASATGVEWRALELRLPGSLSTSFSPTPLTRGEEGDVGHRPEDELTHEDLHSRPLKPLQVSVDIFFLVGLVDDPCDGGDYFAAQENEREEEITPEESGLACAKENGNRHVHAENVYLSVPPASEPIKLRGLPHAG